ncbi:MAG: PIG-L family deacetylase [Anaerolineae bacterium]|nr:PIG-L family deacetylase [Anaerolineae bacterium]
MSTNERRMLVVMAHPDDETFGMAGTIARYVDEGVKVYLICATNGEAGMAEPEFMQGHTSVAEMRLAELYCAAETLGLSRVYTFDYRDSGMAGSPENNHPDCLFAADVDAVAGRIVEVIREVRPQVVVTFDPYGGYGHPDHIATHQATVRAFDSAGDPGAYPEHIEADRQVYRPQKLYFMTFDKRWLRFTVWLFALMGQDPERMGRNKDVNMRYIAGLETPIHARVKTGSYQEIVRRARECHASQLGGLSPRRLANILSSLFMGTEDHYTRAYPISNDRCRERDLFEGVKSDA